MFSALFPFFCFLIFFLAFLLTPGQSHRKKTLKEKFGMLLMYVMSSWSKQMGSKSFQKTFSKLGPKNAIKSCENGRSSCYVSPFF